MTCVGGVVPVHGQGAVTCVGVVPVRGQGEVTCVGAVVAVHGQGEVTSAGAAVPVHGQGAVLGALAVAAPDRVTCAEGVAAALVQEAGLDALVRCAVMGEAEVTKSVALDAREASVTANG